MQYRRLGGSDLFISAITIGGVVRTDEATWLRALKVAFDNGVNAIDTAPMYGCGASERLVRRALDGRRRRILVLSKAGVRWDDPRGRPLFFIRDEHGGKRLARLNSRPDSLRFEVDQSLSRLGVERLDLLQIAQRDPDTPVAETMGTLAELIRAGKVRAVGVSGYSAEDLRVAAAILPLASVQAEYSLLRTSVERDLFPLARGLGLGLLANGAIGHGVLANAGDSTRGLQDERAWNALFAIKNRASIEAAINRVLVPVARRHRATLSQVALAWVLAQPGVTSVVAGASTPRQSAENAAAPDLGLYVEERQALREVFAGVMIDDRANAAPTERIARFIKRAITQPRLSRL